MSTQHHENPLFLLRKKLNLTRSKMATMLGVSLPSLTFYETGVVKNPSKLITKLQELGFNYKKIQADYHAWREFAIKKLKESIKAINL